MGGALSLGLCFGLLQKIRSAPLIALISGLVGMLGDSLLGATCQAMYFCPTCQKETERHIHNCGTTTQLIRGIKWMNNDTVNFLATLLELESPCVFSSVWRRSGEHSVDTQRVPIQKQGQQKPPAC